MAANGKKSPSSFDSTKIPYNSKLNKFNIEYF